MQFIGRDPARRRTKRNAAELSRMQHGILPPMQILTLVSALAPNEDIRPLDRVKLPSFLSCLHALGGVRSLRRSSSDLVFIVAYCFTPRTQDAGRASRFLCSCGRRNPRVTVGAFRHQDCCHVNLDALFAHL